MDILPLSADGKFSIASYGGGGFVIKDTHGAEKKWHGSIFIKPEGVVPITHRTLDDIKLADVIPLLPLKLELLLLGTGARMARPEKLQRDNWQRLASGVEWMATPAAARTYQIAVGEGRLVAALLLAVE
ncbi:MAG: Mth938-like domain-containing protein [Hydrotalea sp.]|nr:Mth938-like domain-containing protein [Hydrotalea sp.]